MPKTYVIKLGGSIISPDLQCIFDFSYARELKDTLSEFIRNGDKFFIVVGGGHLMRQYRDMAMANGITDTKELHWIGTTVNVLNGEVVRVSMQELADPGVFKYEDYYNEGELKIDRGIKVGGGGRPGHSGDVDAVLVATKLKTDMVISLKNVDSVYTADPKTDPNATPIERLNWLDYLALIGNPAVHAPGASYPIDPIASQMAFENKIRFMIVPGRDMGNFKKVLLGEKFLGTVIE